MTTHHNDSGYFSIDDSGLLISFVADPGNNLSFAAASQSRKLFHLHIPYGVRSLPENAFRGYTVLYELTFHESLESIGANAFTRCNLNHVVLPEQAKLGAGVFSSSVINQVTLPDTMDPECARQAAHMLRFSLSLTGDSLAQKWPAEYADIYCGKSESRGDWRQITNDSGTYFLDSDGVLRDFSCAPDNYADQTKKAFLRLNIPEGVKAIPGRMFTNCSVLRELTFPSTLKCIGTVGGYAGAHAAVASCAINTFACCQLPDVVLPPALNLLGHFSFGASTFRSITIPASLRCHLSYTGYARQFKDTSFGEIRVPAEYREALERECRDRHHRENELTFTEQHDPDLGMLCCAKSRLGALRGEVFQSLLREIAGDD